MQAARILGLVACAFAAAACAEAGAPTGHSQPDAPPVPQDGPPPMIDAPVSSCTSSATCQTAQDLGSVSGDTGSQMKSASGYQAAWYKVRVTEDDSGIVGVKLSVTAQLTSPVGSNYDVYMYVNSGTDVIECSSPSGTAQMSGNTDTLRIIWGEGSIPNGSDDSRTVSIEIRPVSGPCMQNAPSQLQITGNT